MWCLLAQPELPVWALTLDEAALPGCDSYLAPEEVPNQESTQDGLLKGLAPTGSGWTLNSAAQVLWGPEQVPGPLWAFTSSSAQ